MSVCVIMGEVLIFHFYLVNSWGRYIGCFLGSLIYCDQDSAFVLL